MTTKNLFNILAIFAGFSLPAIGDVIKPTSATHVSTVGEPRGITAAINGSGLSGGGTSGDILSETVTTVGASDHWLSASSAVDVDVEFRSTTEVLTFDLGGTYDIDAVHLWPYIRTQNLRNLASFDLSFSSDGTNFSDAITLSGWPIGPTSGTAGVETQDFTPVSGITHVRMTNLTTHGSTDYIAIAEIRFGGTPVAAGSVDADTSTVNASPAAVLADGTTTSTITVTLKDASSNPVSGKLVSLANTAGPQAADITTVSDTTDVAGEATFTVTSSTPGTEVFTATDVTDSSLVITDTASVEFQELVVNAGTSTVSASPASLLADDITTSTITVTLRNSGGLLLADKVVTLSGNGENDVAPAGAGTDTTDANGEATFVVKSGTVGPETFTATSETVTVTQTAGVDFQSNVVNAANSTVSASPASVPANDITTSTITVTVMNSGGLPLPGKLVSLAGDGENDVAPAGAGTDTTDANGVATFTVKSGTAGPETFTATSETVTITATASVDFLEVPTGAYITPTGATSESFNTSNRVISKTIDGSGLSDILVTSSELDDVHPYISTTDAPYWLSSVTAPNEELTFNLGGAYNVDGVYYWKYTRDSRRNPQTFDISYSTDGGINYSTPVSAASLNMADWSQSLGAREDSYAELRTFDTLTGITHIRFTNIQVHGGSTNLVGLHEIRFRGVPTSTSSDYATWSGGAPADGDANSDGVKNSVAYALGAADVNENAIGLLPTFVNSDPSNFVFTFNRDDEAEADPKTTISVEYGTTLTIWTSAPNVGDGVTVDDSGPSVGGLTPVIVTIPKALAAGGKLFARLNVEVSP